MKLIKVETKGFKSFAQKVSLSFDGGVVGIVGPNGSGKSNINDAIKWVLGERSVKALRGNSGDDIIFAGSKGAPAADVAEVSLTFDNSDNKISLPHKQITITRVLRRGSGENEYFINGDVARLKEIEEIAMESGISKSSLAIISQGTIQNIAQANPEDRRLIFEEAAGVSKYKSKKDEALRKLDKTTEALEKVEAVVRELEKQLNPLRRQAEKAKIFLAKKEELKAIEIGLLADDIKFFKQKSTELEGAIQGVLEEKENLNQKIRSSEHAITEKSKLKLSVDNDIVKLSQQFHDVSERLLGLEISSSQHSQRRQLIIDGQVKATSQARIAALKEELDELATKIHQFNAWENKLLNDITERRSSLSSKQTTLAVTRNENDNFKRELMHRHAKLSVLNDHENNKSHLFKGTKAILENKQLFNNGIQGIVSDILKVESQYISAIESILATSLQHIVVDKSENAVKAINFLKTNNAGRATFLPLDTIRPKGIAQEHLNVLRTQPGFISVASDIVSTEPKFDVLKKFLLGNILVAQNIEQANLIGKIFRNQYMLVSLDGDIIRAGGVLSGGEKNKSHDMLGVAEKITEIEKEIPKIEEKINQGNAVISKLTNEIAEEQSVVSELNIESVKIREKKSIIEMQFNNLRMQYDEEASEKFIAKKADVASFDLLESEKASLNATLKAKREIAIVLNHDISTLNIEKIELEKSLRNLIDSSSAQINEKNQADFVLSSSSKRLADEYSMTIDYAIDNHKLELEREEARQIVANLRQDIRELGSVNLDAIETFEEVNARHEKLKATEHELDNAKQIILNAISEMDQIIITRLDETIKKVNSEMTIIFQKMFGGGHAEVKYTNPSNLLETGVDVIAQPPGKTIKNLNLFSGGEKAMVAISLLFAILKSKPLPLCILDEVEAALDDANVIRFANYLQELKDQTQFMVITHRVGTMARVDYLFGATMQTKGITSFFSVKLADAQKLIENN